MTATPATTSPDPRALRSSPINAAELHAWLGMTYPRAVAGDAARDVLGTYCRCFAERTGMTLITLVKASTGGHATVVAQSTESQLWADLQAVPDRWDDSFCGRGPAGEALRERRPTLMNADDERLVVWRTALERAGIKCVAAWPVPCSGDRAVLSCYSNEPLDAAVLERADFARAVELLARLMDDADRLAEQRMIWINAGHRAGPNNAHANSGALR